MKNHVKQVTEEDASLTYPFHFVKGHLEVAEDLYTSQVWPYQFSPL